MINNVALCNPLIHNVDFCYAEQQSKGQETIAAPAEYEGEITKGCILQHRDGLSTLLSSQGNNIYSTLLSHRPAQQIIVSVGYLLPARLGTWSEHVVR